MIRFWLTFPRFDYPTPLNIGCGVTAWNRDDAVSIVQSKVFDGLDFQWATISEDVDVSQLDPGHVLPNMGNPVERGVWFPLGY